jgi:nitrate/nitrite transporter NarK
LVCLQVVPYFECFGLVALISLSYLTLLQLLLLHVWIASKILVVCLMNYDAHKLSTVDSCLVTSASALDGAVICLRIGIVTDFFDDFHVNCKLFL